MTRGAVYIASREPYLSEASRSASSLREHHPEIPITLFAPDHYDPPAVFDEMQPLERPRHDFSDSNLGSEHIPYDRTLFLDTDTFVAADISGAFDILDRFDLAAAHDPTRDGTGEHTHEHAVPDSFPQYNTGVIAYRDTAAVRALFERWIDLYHTVDGVNYGLNQPTFRMAAYEADLDIGTLPPEYNFRIGNVANAVAYACGPVRILHGRSLYWDIDDLAARINASHDRRVVIAKPGSFELIENDERSTVQNAAYWADRAHWKFMKDGVGGLASFAANALKARVP